MGVSLQAVANPHTRECTMEDLAKLRDSSKNPETVQFYSQVMTGLEFHLSGLDMGAAAVESTSRRPSSDFSLTAKLGMP